MSAIQRYSEHCQSLQSRREMLEEEYAKLERQLHYFKNAREAYQVVEADLGIESCIKPIEILTERLELTKLALTELDPLPLAMEAWEELEDRRKKFQDEFESQWQKAFEAREVFVDVLKSISELRRKSINLSHESAGIARTLRRNPIEEILIGSNRFDLDVLVNEIL